MTLPNSIPYNKKKGNNNFPFIPPETQPYVQVTTKTQLIKHLETSEKGAPIYVNIRIHLTHTNSYNQTSNSDTLRVKILEPNKQWKTHNDEMEILSIGFPKPNKYDKIEKGSHNLISNKDTILISKGYIIQ